MERPKLGWHSVHSRRGGEPREVFATAQLRLTLRGMQYWVVLRRVRTKPRMQFTQAPIVSKSSQLRTSPGMHEFCTRRYCASQRTQICLLLPSEL